MTAQRTPACHVFTKSAILALGKCRLDFGHRQLLLDAVEAELAVGALERQRVRHRHFLLRLVVIPFVHAPEVGVLQAESEFVDQAGDERELFGRADRSADADRVIRRGLLPGGDVLQGFGEVEVLEGVIHHHLEARDARAGAGRVPSASPRH
jgi:hypothetical protein